MTIGYAFNEVDAEIMLNEVGPDIFIFHAGITRGGTTGYGEGRSIEEMAGIDNNRLFLVDNSLAQDTRWELELFREMIPLKKKWVSHPIEDKPEVLELAAQAGAWYVYQAVFDTSDYIRDRVKRYHDHRIGVEGQDFSLNSPLFRCRAATSFHHPPLRLQPGFLTRPLTLPSFPR